MDEALNLLPQGFKSESPSPDKSGKGLSTIRIGSMHHGEPLLGLASIPTHAQ